MNRPITNKQQQENYDYSIKIVVIGNSGVGKTNMMLRFCDGTYKATHMPTIGVDFKMKVVKVDDIQLKLQVWDTAGQEKYMTLTNGIYNSAAAVLVVFSLTDRASFSNVRMWIQQIHDHNVAESVVIVLVGNKCDEPASMRKVERKEAEDLANEYSIQYYETSAFENIRISQVFEETAKQIKDKFFPNNPQIGESGQKIRLDTNSYHGTPSPAPNNEMFKLNSNLRSSRDGINPSVTPFETNSQSSNCQC